MIDNQYYLTNILGRGASSKVFLASDCNDETFAIKVVNVTDKLPYKAACVMAVREAEILESIEGHPNIIKAFDTNLQGVITHNGQSETVVYTRLEHAANGAISDFVRYSGPLEEQVARLMMTQLCHAVNHMHSQEFVHLDIKLENILLDQFYNVKLADMGCAMDVSDSEGRSDRRRGTPQYMAPEVTGLAKGCSYDAFAADMYSIGVALFVMLVGEFPVGDISSNCRCTTHSDTRSSSTDDAEMDLESKQRWEELSESSKHLIAGLMNADPVKRLSMEEVLNSEWMNEEFDEELRCQVYQEMTERKAYISTKFESN